MTSHCTNCYCLSCQVSLHWVFESPLLNRMNFRDPLPEGFVKSIIGPSLGVFKVNNWAKFVFFKRLCKKPIKIGVSAQFFKIKKAHANFQSQQLGQVGLFFWTPNLAQLLTLTWPSYWLWKWSFFSSFFCFFFFWKCWNTYFYSVFCTSTKICPKTGPKKTITFHILQNTGS